MSVKISNHEIIKRAKEKHGDVFDYSQFTANKLSEKSIIIHNVCGNIFEQSGKEHLDKRRKSGHGCPHCAHKTKTKETFISDAIKKHGDRYDYSNFVFKNYSSDGVIVCNKCYHTFNTTPTKHVTYGYGCPKCAGKLRDENEFIELASKVHSNKYNYAKVEYTNNREEVIIICPHHGEFKQKPVHHLSGRGCNECRLKNVSSSQVDLLGFLNNASKVHKNKYKYNIDDYKNNKSKITIECPIHGYFKQRPGNHINLSHGCPKCNANTSKKEKEVLAFVQSIYDGKIIENSKDIINGFELDIYLPYINLAIEYNGLYWHSEKNIDKNYHLEKTLECERNGIDLFHIFEDDWINKEDIIKSMISNKLKSNNNTIYTRKCHIKEIDATMCSNFLDENHLQGKVNSKVKIGLFYNDTLVSVMTFGNKRINLGQKSKKDHYELLRFANKKFTNVVGASSKLFKYFISKYDPEYIVSYADFSWSKGNIYNILGFKYIHLSKPGYHYIVKNKRENRFKYRKSELIRLGFSEKKTEHEIMLENKYYRIYDCGTLKFEWYK